MDFLRSSLYYNKPEGEDLVGKMVATNKYMLAGAIPAATIDVILYSHPKGTLATVARFFKWFGPAVGMASAFTVGVYAATNLRGKDDNLNYIIGACAAASVFGKAIRNPVIGFQCCAAFSLAACLKKISVQEGWTWFPDPEWARQHHQYGTLRTSKYDYTMIQDTPEKGWTNKRE